jgi:hypothetical protein
VVTRPGRPFPPEKNIVTPLSTMTVLWDVTPSSLVNRYWRFKRKCCIHLQTWKVTLDGDGLD